MLNLTDDIVELNRDVEPLIVQEQGFSNLLPMISSHRFNLSISRIFTLFWICGTEPLNT